MKTRFWYLLILGFLSFSPIATSCSDDKEEEIVQPPDEPENPDVPKPPVIDVTVTMKDATVEGVVTDVEGNPLGSVTISSGEAQATTNDMGLFTFERIASANGRFVFTFKKDGYFTITRSGVFSDNLSMQVVMQSRNNASNVVSTSFSATSKNALKANGMEVAIPASSLVTASGTDYTGTVNADMLYLSPDNENFTTMMPGGDMAAVRTDRSDATLVSYGMVEVSLTDNSGNPLQLKKGSQSEMTFPIPESMKDNPPATIPLWYFNEEAGVWVEEGTATLQGNVYVGSVSHFSWHNLDVPEERVTIKGKMTDCKGRPVSRLLVTVDQTSDITSSDGSYQVYVPANTPVTVTVKSENYMSYSPEVRVSVAGQSGGTTLENINLELPCIPVISGRVTNSCSDLVGAYVWAEYISGGKAVKTVPIWTSVDGSFELRIPGTSGKATLWVQTANGDKISRIFDLTGQDIVITGLEICEEFDEGTLTITVEDGQTLVVPWLPEKSFGMLNGTQVAIMCGQGMIGTVENYAGVGKENATCTFAYISAEAIYQFEPICVFEISDKGGYEVSITGSGQAISMTDGTTSIASITGKIYIPTFIEASETQNVGKWSDVGMGNSIPEMPLPIDQLVKLSFSGMEAGIAGLAYKNKAESDYNSVKSTLEKAGYTVVEQEVTDGEGNKSVGYKKGDNLVAVTYSPKGGENILGDGEDYKLVIIVCEGYSKIQQLVGLFDTGIVTRNAPILRSFKR